jgi:hypothetical protein
MTSAITDRLGLGPNPTQALFNSFLAQVTFDGAAADGYSDAWFHRTAAYLGGMPGHVATALTVQTDVTGVGVTNFEWASLAILNNSATGGENVASYAQGNRMTSTTGPTWAAVLETREMVPINNPTSGLVSLEVDVRSNGTDNNFNRVGIDVVLTRFDPGGPDTTSGFGVRVGNNQDGAHSFITNAFSVFDCNAAVAYDCAFATVTTGALRMAAGQPILFDAAGLNQLAFNGLGLDYSVSGALQTRLLATGGLQVEAAQVVGPRNTGWNPWTGILNNASVYDASTVTLVQLAQRVAAIQNALTTHGLLGL